MNTYRLSLSFPRRSDFHADNPRIRSGTGLLRMLLFGSLCCILTPQLRADVIEFASGAFVEALSPADGAKMAVSGAAGMEAALLRGEVQPHERFAEALIKGELLAHADAVLQAELHDVRSGEMLARKTLRDMAGPAVLITVDMRQLDTELARLRITVAGADQKVATESLLTRTPVDPPSLPDSVPILVSRPASAPDAMTPVTFGVPFPSGALWSLDGLRLVDGQGRDLPAQFECTALWAREGSIRWVRIDTAAPAKGDMALRFDGGSISAAADDLRVDSIASDVVDVHAGDMVYRFDAAAGSLQSIARVGKKMADMLDARGLYVVDNQGRTASAGGQGTELTVEADGPRHVCVRIEGPYHTAEGEELARHITRFEFNAGKTGADIYHTLVLTRDTREVWFKEIGWELQAYPGTASRGTFAMLPPADETVWRQDNLTPGAQTFVFQKDHTYFGMGKPIVMRGTIGADGKPEDVSEGDGRMGDWFALQGADGGLAWICKDAARQHPKEFLLTGNMVNLRLFSPRGGDELDFRADTLVRKWKLDEWFPSASREEYQKAHGGDALEAIAEHESNAAGWAKTHFLRLVPLLPETEPESLHAAALAVSEPVFAYADPEWVYHSRVLGPLYPRDTEHFPAAEAYIEGVLDRLYGLVRDEFNGFVDYWAGPTYRIAPTRVMRYRLTYGIRPGLWLAFARSGNRDTRAFALATNRAFLDNHMAHWESENKTRGLYNASGGGRFHVGMSDLPFYWGDRTRSNISSSTDLDQFLLDYYMTGYRRGLDAVRQFGEGVKQIWDGENLLRSPGFTTRRPLATLRVLTQVYITDWDPEMRAIISETIDFLYEPAGIMATSKRYRGGNSSIYKTRADVRALLLAADFLPGRRIDEMARLTAEYQWNTFLGSRPVRYMNPLGVAANYLDRLAPSDLFTSAADWYVRAIAARYNPVDGTVQPPTASAFSSVVECLPYMMSLAIRHARDNAAPAPWISVGAADEPGLLAVNKEVYQGARIDVRAPFPDPISRSSVGSRITVASLANMGNGLIFTDQTGPNAGFGSVARIDLTMDARGGHYFIIPESDGYLYALADQSIPMVLVQPGFREFDAVAPARRVYFDIQSDAIEPRIYFEEPTTLYAPDGEMHGTAKSHRRWVRLPADMPGLWSFESAGGRVALQGVPPVFAFDNPQWHFMPDLQGILKVLPRRIFSDERFADWPVMPAAEGEYPATDDLVAWDNILRNDPVNYRRHLALDYLAQGDQPGPALAYALNDTDWSIRALAVDRIGELRLKDLLDNLLEIMESDPDAAVRARAKAALIGFGELIFDDIVAMLNHADNAVQSRAAILLGELGDIRAVPFLIDKLRNFDDWRVRNRAVDALRALSGTDFSGELVRDPERWEQWLQSR